MSRRPFRPRYYKLETAIQYKSLTKPWPFVVAHECSEEYTDQDGAKQLREREYFAFDDLESFEHVRAAYPHAHEVVFARNGFTQEGRLVFDFDIDKLYYKITGRTPLFVSPSFEKDVEFCVYETFKIYYNNVDNTKLIFIWLATNHPDKYSQHLIVKHAVFTTDWTIQLYTFYALYALIAHRSGLFDYLPLDKRVDMQVAKTNTTMRMAYSSKLKNGRVMLPTTKHFNDGMLITLRDTLIQLHNKHDAKTEQRIVDTQLAIDKVLQLTIGELTSDEKILLRKLPQLQRALEDMDRESNYASFEMTHECEELVQMVGDCFEVRSIEPGRILLNRVSSGPCPISGNTHDSESACILVYRTGASYFHCFRPMCLMPDGSNKLKLRGEGDVLPTFEESLRYFEGTEEIEKHDRERGIVPDVVPLDPPVQDDSSSDVDDVDDVASVEENDNASSDEEATATIPAPAPAIPTPNTTNTSISERQIAVCTTKAELVDVRRNNWKRYQAGERKIPIPPTKKTLKAASNWMANVEANKVSMKMSMPDFEVRI